MRERIDHVIDKAIHQNNKPASIVESYDVADLIQENHEDTTDWE